jgi:hypothetical protein
MSVAHYDYSAAIPYIGLYVAIAMGIVLTYPYIRTIFSATQALLMVALVLVAVFICVSFVQTVALENTNKAGFCYPVGHENRCLA